MLDIKQKIAQINWQQVREDMNDKGFTWISEFLTHESCEELVHHYNYPLAYRKTVIMERHRFGLGEYKYFNYPLPNFIQTIREEVYPRIAPIANSWMKVLNINKQFSTSFEELQSLCHNHNQTKPAVLILKYGKGGYNTLHQDLYGEIYFPMQLVLFLNEPEKEYTGGEFVMTEQKPRSQPKAVVLKPKKGDMFLFTTNFRPVKGEKGYYRVMMKHGVSQVHQGVRHTLGVIFHDAIS
ncbi:2OG-Fe(II) oxygenase [Xanthovirga aplysinae]|uniref:2OG-Fe(II) oxygenase n=1 Tax=Xanthovirga aplysinae TaxID=2529853 RepID=UPI0012BC5DFC|nr:2OG-Fe(II) oxygenase [Xanthovirga aplysinae]MTI32092.1 prolyl 4-hydroxylase subunit alpha [Xanthovirga aplysinae]